MTHELKSILSVAYNWQSRGIRSVLATVVALEGSSYRRPGVRMLISDSGEVIGAVSGGCVEKEVLRQAESVFGTGISKIMTYDGRYRLGCEGILYILIEPIEISQTLLEVIQDFFKNRKTFHSISYYIPEVSQSDVYGTVLKLDGNAYLLNSTFSKIDSEQIQTFRQEFKPIFQLYIFGAEHDAVQLCDLASRMGWEVHIIASPDEEKTIEFFKGATTLSSPFINEVDVSGIGLNTAVILMTHSLNKDVQYLMALKDTNPEYIGLLGPSRRRERLLSEFLNYFPETPYHFFESIHGPTGLNIGAETSAEIALSIIAEILSVTRNTEVMSLKEKSGNIHD